MAAPITSKRFPNPASTRGAVIIQVAIALIGLMAFSAFVVDYGVLWSSRRQAQNAADAAAMAGAISLAYVDFNDQPLARQSALAFAAQNKVWGKVPDVTAADITFPVCPPGAPGAGTNSCVRANVFRNQRAGGSALPTFFGKLVGVNDQGVKATATAEALFGNTTDCIKPFAIPDKWTELRGNLGPPGWSEEDTFERYDKKGAVLSPADIYSGGGFSAKGYVSQGGDLGRYITLKNGDPHDTIAPGIFKPVVINPGEGPGAKNFSENIAECDNTAVGPGTVLEWEPGNMKGPTKKGMADLIALDPKAEWDPDFYGPGKGGVKGSCCAKSPRLIAIPVFNPDAYDLGKASGRHDITITNVLGFFIDKMQGDDVAGWITIYPSEPSAGMGGIPGSAFVVSATLVR